MREQNYQQKRVQYSRNKEIYRLRVIEGLEISSIMEKMHVSRVTVYRSLSTFERDNPKQVEQMKKQGKNVTPEDYKELLKEISELKKSLAQERLRADFYEEMVAFGKEVYGIDLKKAGTK